MIKSCFRKLTTLAVVLVATGGGQQALASDYPALDGQAMRVMIGSSAGQNTDLKARAFFKSLQEELPETTIRIQNIKSSKALVELNDASDNSLTILVSSRTPYFGQIARPNKDIDMTKVVFLGSLGKVNRILAVRKDFAESADDMIASGKIPVLGAKKPDPSAWEPMVIDYLTPLNLKVIVGMSEGERESMILKGDISGRVGGALELQPLFDEGVLAPILKFTSEGYPSELDHVPAIADLMKDGVDGDVLAAIETIDRIGGVVIASKATLDSDTIEALQEAFSAAAADETFMQEVVKLRSVVSFTDGREMTELMQPLLSEAGGVPAKMRDAIACGSSNDETGSDDC